MQEKEFAGTTYMDTELAARKAGLHAATLRKAARAKQITHLQMEGRYWFLEEWTTDYVKEHISIGTFVPRKKGRGPINLRLPR